MIEKIVKKIRFILLLLTQLGKDVCLKIITDMLLFRFQTFETHLNTSAFIVHVDNTRKVMDKVLTF